MSLIRSALRNLTRFLIWLTKGLMRNRTASTSRTWSSLVRKTIFVPITWRKAVFQRPISSFYPTRTCWHLRLGASSSLICATRSFCSMRRTISTSNARAFFHSIFRLRTSGQPSNFCNNRPLKNSREQRKYSTHLINLTFLFLLISNYDEYNRRRSATHLKCFLLRL